MSRPVQPATGGAVHSQRGGSALRRLFRIYLEKPELAGVALLVLLTLVFEIRSNGVFLSAENLRGILGLLPEVGLVSIGVTVLMICGEFDLSVGSMFALMPVSVALMTNAGIPFIPAILFGLTLCAVCGMLCQTVATGYVTMTAKEGRSSAVGLYASIYYVGGSAGAFLGGIAWSFAGWPGCVATIAAMLVIIAAIVAAAWE